MEIQKFETQALNYNILQTIPGIKLIFFLWLNIHIINKFTQVFQLGVCGHACLGIPKAVPNIESL